MAHQPSVARQATALLLNAACLVGLVIEPKGCLGNMAIRAARV